VIDALGPADRAAVLFTSNRHSAQTFTTDRGLLRAAVENAAIVPEPPDTIEGIGPGDQGFCPCGVCSIEAIERVARTLRPVPEQRKTLFYISAGSVVSVPRSLIAATATEPPNGATRKEHCAWERYRAMDRAMRQAQLANVTIDAFDPTGVGLGRHATPNTTPKLGSGSSGAEADGQYGSLEDPATLRTESLRAFADSTGGRAVVNSNDVHLEVPAVLAASASYYLIGVEPPPASANGRFHPIDVRVQQRDLQVRTRAGYYDPTAADASLASPLVASGAGSSIASPMPLAGFPLEVAAVPFASTDGAPELALTIAIWPPAGDTRPLPRTESTDVVAALFDSETGDARGSHEARVRLTWPRNARFGFSEVVSRLPARAGRYELRVGVTAEDGRTASVYTSVDVPAFDAPLSVSGLILNAAPPPAAGQTSDLSDLVPVVPTSRRTFSAADTVMAFLRVYQTAGRVTAARVVATLRNARDEVVSSDTLALEGRTTGSRWTADYEVALPINTLEPGDYLFTTDVAAGDRSERRTVRFLIER
jgi:VWFA-related protein